MKNVFLFLVGIIVLPYQSHGQNKNWVNYARFYKKITVGGGIPNAVNWIDEDGFYGSFDSASVINERNEIIKTTKVRNTAVNTGGQFVSAGDIGFNSQFGGVGKHIKIESTDYLLASDEPFLKKLNVTTNTYEGVPIPSNWSIGNIIDWNQTQVLLLGIFIVDSKQYSVVIADKNDFNSYTVITSSEGVDYNRNTFSEDNDALFMFSYVDIYQTKVHRLRKGESSFTEHAIIPIDILHIMQSAAPNKDTLYVASVKFGPTYGLYQLVLGMESFSWTEVVRFGVPNTPFTIDRFIVSLICKNNLVYLSGIFTSMNGAPMNYGVSTYNPKTGESKSLCSAWPRLGTGVFFPLERAYQIVGIFFVGDDLFLSSNTGFLGTYQLVFKYGIEDTTPPPVNIAVNGPFVTEYGFVAEVFGTTEPDTHIDIFSKFTPTNPLDNAWEVRLGVFTENGTWLREVGSSSTDGIWQIYVKTYDWLGNESESSDTLIFRISIVTGLEEAEKVSVFPNPSTGNDVTVRNVRSIKSISGLTGSKIEPLYFKNGDDLVIENDLAPGKYILECENMEGKLVKTKLMVIN